MRLRGSACRRKKRPVMSFLAGNDRRLVDPGRFPSELELVQFGEALNLIVPMTRVVASLTPTCAERGPQCVLDYIEIA